MHRNNDNNFTLSTLHSQLRPRRQPRRDGDTRDRASIPPRRRMRNLLVARAGIEPATHGFSVRCSTN